MIPKISGPRLPPATGSDPARLVVLLHGYGADGSDLIGLGPHIQSVLPDALIVSPNAPEPSALSALGRQWFALDLEGQRVASRQAGLAVARPVLAHFLADLAEETGIGPEDTVLAGFSQGAMMALNTGLSLDDALMGIVAFSGAFVPPENFGPASPKPPVCLVHGDRDEVVDAAFSAAAERELAAMGIEVRHHVSRGTGHGIAPDGLAFALDFIAGLAADR